MAHLIPNRSHTGSLLAPSALAMVALTLSTALTPTVRAADLDALDNLGQGEFKALSEDLGAALSYKSLAPAATLGITGFDLSLSVTGTSLESLDTWKTATGDNDIPSTLPVPMLRLAKGLPLNIDVGAFYLQIPDSNIKLYGAEARWAFIEGGALTPAVSLHATYSKVTGVDQLDFKTKSVDISISKGFTVITPYAGVGQVWTDATPLAEAATAGLKKESLKQSKVFGGLSFNFGLPVIALEADQTGGITSYGAKFGLRW